MLFFSTFCLFYRFTVLPVFFWGGEVAWFVWFVWSGLFGSFLFPSLFVSLFACWAMNSRNVSIVKILQKHVLFETWNATHWYHANLMDPWWFSFDTKWNPRLWIQRRGSIFQSNCWIQSEWQSTWSWLLKPQKTHKITEIASCAFIKRHFFLVGGWTQHLWKTWSSKWESSPGRGENIKCLKPPPSFWLVKTTATKKHTPNQVRVPWRSLSTKCCGWRSRTWGEFSGQETLHEFILELFGGEKPPLVFLPSNIFRIWRSWGSAQERSIALLKCGRFRLLDCFEKSHLFVSLDWP